MLEAIANSEFVGEPQIVRGYIADDALSPNDEVEVLLPSYDMGRKFGPVVFDPRALQDGTVLLPSRNDPCVVALDEDDNVVLLSWWAEDPTTARTEVVRVPIQGAGITDHDAIQTALNQAAADGYNAQHRVTVSLAGKKWNVNQQLTVDTHFVILDLGGAVLSFSALPNGATYPTANVGLYLTANPDTVEGQKSWDNSVTSVRNGQIIGPGYNSAFINTIGLLAERTTGLSGGIGPARITIANVVIRDFGTDIQYGNNTWGINHVDCEFYNANIGINMPSGLTNSGERMTYRGCNVFGCRSLIINAASGCDMQWIGGSIDYPVVDSSYAAFGVAGTANPKTMMIYAAGGRVYVSNAHIEASHDTDYWFRSGVGGSFDNVSRIVLTDCDVTIAGNKTQYEVGISTDQSGVSGITFENVHWHENSGYSYGLGSWVAGNGLVRPRGVSFEPNVIQWMAPFSQSINRVDGTFEGANAIKDWTGTVGDAPAVDTAAAYAGTHSMKFAVVTNGNNSRLFLNLPARPGDLLLMSFRNLISGAQSGAVKFLLQVGWLKLDGATFITSAQYGASASGADHWDDTAGAWLLRKIPGQVAPAGTATLQIYFQFNGQLTASVARIDDVIINLIS